MPDLEPLNMHCTHGEYVWHPDTCTEAGWRCMDCDKAMGWRPDLDRSEAQEKIHSILFWAHEQKLIYISNGTEGEIVTDNVEVRCVTEDLFDSYSILRFILEDPNLASHAPFWQQRARQTCGICGKSVSSAPEGDCLQRQRHTPELVTSEALPF